MDGDPFGMYPLPPHLGHCFVLGGSDGGGMCTSSMWLWPKLTTFSLTPFTLCPLDSEKKSISPSGVVSTNHFPSAFLAPIFAGTPVGSQASSSISLILGSPLFDIDEPWARAIINLKGVQEICGFGILHIRIFHPAEA